MSRKSWGLGLSALACVCALGVIASILFWGGGSSPTPSASASPEPRSGGPLTYEGSPWHDTIAAAPEQARSWGFAVLTNTGDEAAYVDDVAMVEVPEGLWTEGPYPVSPEVPGEVGGPWPLSIPSGGYSDFVLAPGESVRLFYGLMAEHPGTYTVDHLAVDYTVADVLFETKVQNGVTLEVAG